MKRFEIGDKVVSLFNTKDSCAQIVEKGVIYTVLELMYCSKCGRQLIHVGGGTKIQTTNYGNCDCGNRLFMTLAHTYSEGFSKIDETGLEEVVEKEE